MKNNVTLGVSGDLGSFSEEAGMLYAKNNNFFAKLEYLIDMEQVLKAIEKNQIDLGIFPVVNLRGGLVRMAFDAMGKYKFQVIDEIWLDVHQCILGNPGMIIDQVKNIVSHPQAIAQCSQFIQHSLCNSTLTEWQDTAKAARELSEGKLPPGSAVIAPERAAQVYGLDVMVRNIQDENPNLTAFIVVRKSTN